MLPTVSATDCSAGGDLLASISAWKPLKPNSVKNDCSGPGMTEYQLWPPIAANSASSDGAVLLSGSGNSSSVTTSVPACTLIRQSIVGSPSPKSSFVSSAASVYCASPDSVVCVVTSTPKSAPSSASGPSFGSPPVASGAASSTFGMPSFLPSMTLGSTVPDSTSWPLGLVARKASSGANGTPTVTSPAKFRPGAKSSVSLLQG